MFDSYCIPMNPNRPDVKISADEILDMVCCQFNEERAEVASKCRVRNLVMARHAFCYLAYKYSEVTLKGLAKLIGGRDHTTTLHSINVANNLLEAQDKISLSVAGHIRELEDRITAPYYKHVA